MTTSPKPTTGPVIFGREMHEVNGGLSLRLTPLGPACEIQFGCDRPHRWIVWGCDAGTADNVFEAAALIEDCVRRLMCGVAPLLDDSAKREVVKAMGFTFPPLTEDEQARQREEVLNWDFERECPRDEKG